MHIAEVVTIAKSLPLLRLNTYKSLILSYSADYRRILRKKHTIFLHLEDNKLRENGLFSAIFSLISRKKREITAERY